MCELGDDGALIIAELISHRLFPNLTTLLLDSASGSCFSPLDNDISSIGLRALSVVLTTTCVPKGLYVFSVTGNALDADGVDALSTILRNNSKLQRLWASCKGVCATQR